MVTNEKREKPNVIWIFGDQHRTQALSCHGDPNVSTPNIDTLAATGVDFTGAVAGYPLCCPFRGSLLTSRYPHKCVPMHESPMPPNQPTLAHVFNDAGYKTAYIGKWHLDGFQAQDGRPAYHIVPPEHRGGFQHWVGYANNNSPWDSWVHGGEGEDAFHYRLPGYETDELTNLFIDYIRERGQEQADGDETPFFAALPGYYAMIENLDWNVGRIRQALFETGLAFNTHIIFFSDHGDMHGSHGEFRKTSPYEESIRIPFIISGNIPHDDGRKKMGTFPFRSTMSILPRPPWDYVILKNRNGWKGRITPTTD